MRKLLSNKYINLIFRLILGYVFIYASIDKIQNPAAFSDTIDNFHISPISINNFLALFIPWLELIIGICLITGIFISGASIISIGLFLLFIFVLSQAVIRGIDTDCGCFKVTEEIQNLDYKAKLIKRIIEDILLLSMTFVVYRNIHNFRGLKSKK